MAQPNQVLLEWYQLKALAVKSHSKKKLETYVPQNRRPSLTHVAGRQVKQLMTTISRPRVQRQRSSSMSVQLERGITVRREDQPVKSMGKYHTLPPGMSLLQAMAIN